MKPKENVDSAKLSIASAKMLAHKESKGMTGDRKKGGGMME